MIGAMVGMTVGGMIPMLWGDDNVFSGSGMFFAMVGGFTGIWLVFWASKKLG